MNTNIQASKSILAKLLASENITVSHQQVKTAYFDLKNRTMVLPIWKDMDGDLYDLLTGHEVGHALNTPEQGWHDQVAANSKKYKDFLNVIEDARIEKLVKRKFPGLAKSFSRAYASLYERDFFGIKKLGDLNKLNLIDRINLRFKLGAHVVVEFNDFERDIVREVENAETWDQVVDIAQRVYEYVKQNEQDKIQNTEQLTKAFAAPETEQEDSGEQDSDDSFDEEDDEFRDADDSSEDGDDSDLSEESDGQDSQPTEDQEDSDEDSDEDTDEDTEGDGDGGDGEDEDEPQSVTDQQFRRRENELVNASGKVFMFNLPEVNLDNIILPNTEVMNDLEKFFREQIADTYKPYGRNKVSYETVVQKAVRRFNSDNKKVIMHILKEFEMRKKASEYARTQTARTGELNMNVLHKYKFSNDLFRKITVVPKGKNHGFILFVDMSGSMSDLIRNTIDQMLILVSFCKLANVPVEVYGFSDDAYGNKKLAEMVQSADRFISDPLTEMRISNDYFHLKHLIGTSLPPLQYRKAFNMLCVVANEYPKYDYRYYNGDIGGDFGNWESSGFGLNSTPFIQTLLASREMIKKFQRAHQLDVCNVVYLTDGEGGSDLSYPATDGLGIDRNAVYYLIDKKTQKKIKLQGSPWQLQAPVTELVAEVTGCKHIGFYVGREKAIKYEMKYLLGDKSFNEQQEMRKSMNIHKFFTTKNRGYEKYFYVALPNNNVKDDKLNITQDMTKSKMAKAFGENLNSKRTNRLLLTKLAEELAVA